MMLQMQLVDTRIAVTCPDDAFARAFARYMNAADHRLVSTSNIELQVGHDGSEYILSSGYRALSAEIAAEETWNEVERHLHRTLRPWLQIAGMCIDGPRRILVIGEDRRFLRLLALHGFFGGLAVSSAAGIYIKDGMAVPYALAIDVPPENLARFRATTGCQIEGDAWRTEMGSVRIRFTPLDFGLPWCISPRPVDMILLARYNPGGWSGLGVQRHPSAALDTTAAAVHLPDDLTPVERVSLLSRLQAFTTRTSMRDLYLGCAERFVPLVLEQLDFMRERG